MTHRSHKFGQSIAEDDFLRVRDGDSFVSFAQNLEDLQIYKLLGRFPTNYIDIGCSLPVTNSVTYSAYGSGGRGTCVDIREDAVLDHQIVRHRDTQIHGAVTASSSRLSSVFLGARASHSTMDPRVGNALVNKGMAVKADAVDLRQLSLEDLGGSAIGQSIDLLAMDIEGLEFEILAQHPFHTVKPRIIVFESVVPPLASNSADVNLRKKTYNAAKDNLMDSGYSLAYCDGLNEFWTSLQSERVEVSPPTFYDNYISSKHLVAVIFSLASFWQRPASELIEELPKQVAAGISYMLEGK